MILIILLSHRAQQWGLLGATDLWVITKVDGVSHPCILEYHEVLSSLDVYTSSAAAAAVEAVSAAAATRVSSSSQQ